MSKITPFEVTMCHYQTRAHRTSLYYQRAQQLTEPSHYYITQLLATQAIYAGLVEEVGEVARMLNRVVRDDVPIDRDALRKELGDVLWFISELATINGLDLDDIARANLNKLSDRQQRDKIQGEGDER